MTQTITFKLVIIGGNASVNPTFDFRQIFRGHARIEAYKNVRFVQVSGSASLTYACVNYNIGANVLM